MIGSNGLHSIPEGVELPRAKNLYVAQIVSETPQSPCTSVCGLPRGTDYVLRQVSTANATFQLTITGTGNQREL